MNSDRVSKFSRKTESRSSSSRDQPLVAGEDLVRGFKRGKIFIHPLNHVDIELYPGEMVVVMGPSGSGKTTLLNVLSGLDKPTEGKVFYEGKDITDWKEEQLAELRRDKIGFCFQQSMLIKTLTVLENVEMPLYPTKDKSEDIRSRSVSLLKLVGLHDKINASASKLSGGEESRVAIARALITRPEVIFADEPTGNLDEDTGTTIMREFKRVSRRGEAVLVATHDDSWKEYADRLFHLRSGKLTSSR